MYVKHDFMYCKLHAYIEFRNNLKTSINVAKGKSGK